MKKSSFIISLILLLILQFDVGISGRSIETGPADTRVIIDSSERQAQTDQEKQFESKLQQDWKEIEAFRAKLRNGQTGEKTDPQYRLAREYFEIYLKKRSSTIATEALGTAFTMWGDLKGTSDEVRRAVGRISFQEDVWGEIIDSLTNSFARDERLNECFALLEKLERKVTPLQSRTSILYVLAGNWLRNGRTDEARHAYQQIIDWNASKWYVEKAKGYLYAIEKLGVGQPAPQFAVKDIDGKLIDLSTYRGKAVLLDFWATWCGPCLPELPHLRELAQTYPNDQFAIIAISLDTDLSKLRAKISEEHLNWPHIMEAGRFDGNLARLYNINFVPNTYIIDKRGRIAFKGKLGGELMKAVASLLSEQQTRQ